MSEIKYVYVNGCSYANGNGLSGSSDINHYESMGGIKTIPERYSYLLAKKFDAVELNDALGGGSNQRIYRKTFDWASKNPDKLNNTLFVIQWSYGSRNELWYQGATPDETGQPTPPSPGWKGNWYNSYFGHDGYTSFFTKKKPFPTSPEESNPDYILPNKQLSDITLRYALSLQSFFKLNNIPYIMFDGDMAVRPPNLIDWKDGSELNRNSKLGKLIDFSCWVDVGFKNYAKDRLTECNHPNAEVQIEWAGKLYSFYKEKYR